MRILPMGTWPCAVSPLPEFPLMHPLHSLLTQLADDSVDPDLLAAAAERRINGSAGGSPPPTLFAGINVRTWWTAVQ